jgi:hypothetical protein
MGAIKIGVDPPEYRQQVSPILETIFRNPVGHVIISLIQNGKKDVGIYPVGKDATREDDYAVTSPLKQTDAAPKGVSARGPEVWYAGHPDSPFTPHEDERLRLAPQGLTGTGAGTHAIIRFSPERVKTDKVWDSRPDSCLVHELVHALRMAQGLRNMIPTKDPDWMNEEEFWAVVVQNVYLSAGGGMRLRDGYHSEILMVAPKNTSAGFLDHETKYSGKFIKEHLGIFTKHATTWGQVYTGLGLVGTARFNPFREYLGRHM